MEKLPSVIVLWLICILSRLISSIYYIEDPESLRLALSLSENISEGFYLSFSDHPVFFLIAKFLFHTTGSLSVVFSVIGGTALCFIIIFILNLINVPLISLEGVLTGILIFFNPMIWIVSNKYHPDLAGVAVMIAAFYYLVPDTYKKYDLFIGWFLVGILGGIKLSYIPFIIIPAIYALVVKKRILPSLSSLFLGISIWIVPVILMNEWSEFVQSISEQAHQYFQQGPSVFIEKNYWQGFVRLVQSLWADGLGGYWIDRNPPIMFISIGLAACIFFGILILLNFGIEKAKMTVVVFSLLTYAIWAYLFEDIIYNSDIVLPLVPFLVILVSYGIIYFLVNFNFIYIKVFTLIFLAGNILLTVVLAVHHTYPTAIAQAQEYILSKKEANEKIIIIASPEVNDFLTSQKIRAHFISAPEEAFGSLALKYGNASERIIMIGNLDNLKGYKNKEHFYHNPYLNRRWPEIYLYEYSRK